MRQVLGRLGQWFRLGEISGPLLGVDIGHHSLKVVQLAHHHGEWSLEGVGMAPLPSGAVENGVVRDVEGVSKILIEACKMARASQRQAAAAVGGALVVVREIETPVLPPAQLRNAVRFEAERFLPYNIHEAMIQFQVLRPVEGTPTPRQKVMVMAAQAAAVNSRVATLIKAGLDPLVVDLESFATAYALLELADSFELWHSNVALVDLGASHTEVTVLQEGNPIFVRSIPIGGHQLDRMLAGTFDLSLEEARQWKEREASALPPREEAPQPLPEKPREAEEEAASEAEEAWIPPWEQMGLPPSSEGVEGEKVWDLDEGEEPAAQEVPTPEAEALRLYRALLPSLESLASEIDRTFNYVATYRSVSEMEEERFVQRVYLMGGGALMHGLAQYLQGFLNVPVEVLNPLERLRPATLVPEEILHQAPRFVVAAGLAVRQHVLRRKEAWAA